MSLFDTSVLLFVTGQRSSVFNYISLIEFGCIEAISIFHTYFIKLFLILLRRLIVRTRRIVQSTNTWNVYPLIMRLGTVEKIFFTKSPDHVKVN